MNFFPKVVYKDNKNRSQTQLFTKPIGRRHNHQNKHSKHPENLKRSLPNAAQKMKFSSMNFFSECDQIRRKLWIWSHLLKKSLCAVQQTSVKNKQRICCEKERDRNLNKLGKGLVQRSYSKHCFNIKFAKPISITRKTLLRNEKKEREPTKTIPLIAKYNPILPQFKPKKTMRYFQN